MWRATLLLTVGILCTALLSSAASVYVFHDLDRSVPGNVNDGFLSLCIESLLFALMIGTAVGLVVLLVRALSSLRNATINPRLALYLGIGITVLQYPWEFAVRKLVSNGSDMFLLDYIVAAILICVAAFLFDNVQSLKRSRAV